MGTDLRMTTGTRLQDQVAWVSGASSGMGEAIARLFAREGAAVALVDLQVEKGRVIADQIRGEGGRAVFVECDVRREDDVRASVERTVAEFGGLQTIVNCAGIVQVKQLHELDVADWDRLMDVNVKSIFLSIKHGVAHLKKHLRSYVVNIGSVGSFIGQGATPAYTASKGAVLQLSKSIALDYAADGVRCNCVCPGITDTPMFREHMNKTPDPEAAIAARLRRVPMGVSLSPETIAKSVLYFACEDSAGITGTSLIVDGGYLAAAEWEHPGRTRFMEPR
jgi:NAD(P)-dependent dehydrogenase (short-subunit alcohol dehydrogenase family)